MSLRKVRRAIREGEEVAAGAPVTLRRDVGYELIAYLEENQREFPGVAVQRVFVRHYPNGTLAAHLLGSVGEVSGDELKEAPYENLEPGDEVGKAGVEYTYDRYLRGEPGLTKIQVNALGQLTIDPDVQAAGEAALASRGLPGAFVSMNIDTGQILGLGSFPTFDPSVLAKPLTQKQVDELYRDPVLAPLFNRATEGAYPTGSVFKIITALAALENGVITPGSTIVDDGELTVGGQTFQNAGEASYGALTLVPALQVSSDVFFYTLGLDMWDTGDLQEWAHKMGIGRPTGLDLPEEFEGLLPTRQWRDQLFEEELTERPWSAGDNIQLATGQGDLQTNPLQMAIAYAALGNGGKIVTPHVGMEIEDAAGRVQKEFSPGIRRRFPIDPGAREAILEGLHEAAQVAPGTAAGIFGGFKVPIAGKTGTAERPGHADQSWFAALSPYPDPRIVTIATIEEGGFGAESAAPAVLQILEAYYNTQATEVSSAGGAE